MNLINKQVVITSINDGLGQESNNIQYTNKAYNKIVTIKHKLTEILYITDFFIPEFINEKNDYIHYGFLIVSENNISLINN